MRDSESIVGAYGMNERVGELMAEIRRLEDELAAEMQLHEAELLYWFDGKKIRFEQSIAETHRRLKIGLLRWMSASDPRSVLSAPFIYAMIFPFLLLDGSVSIFQAICFRLYRIPRVRRDTFIMIDQHQLRYLNQIEKLNCVYCAYANGVIGYAREIAARTEQYWCPIKHARRVLDPHSRYARFSDFGDSVGFHENVLKLREALQAEDDSRV